MEPKGQGHSTEPWGWLYHPNGPAGQNIRLKKIIALLGFRLVWDPSSLFFFWFLPFAMGMFNLSLSYHCILETQNLSGFTGSQLGRNSASGWSDFQFHPYLIQTWVCILDFRVDAATSLGFGVMEVEWVYFACEKNINIGARDGMLWTESCPPIHILMPGPQYGAILIEGPSRRKLKVSEVIRMSP